MIKFVWLLALLLAAYVLSLSFASVVNAQPGICFPRATAVETLAREYQEAPVAIGVTSTGGLIEVLATGDGKTWTIIISTPDGQSCLVAAGEGWRAVGEGANPKIMKKLAI